MINKGPVLGLFFWICLYSLSGCSSGQSAVTDGDSKKVDSLISVQKINNSTLLVKLGYDAITAINTDRGIVIVDAGISSELTAKYRKLIENEFHNDDFIYVVNSHGHHDHIAGNTVFPQARVVGHENCSMDVSERWTNPSKSMISLSNIIHDYDQQLQQSAQGYAEWKDIFTQKIRYLSAYSDVKNRIPVRLPDITFSDSMTLELGGTVFEMMYFGRSHSNSDIVIYIPQLKIIFTGDLFSKFGRPGIDLSEIDKVRSAQSIVWIQNRMNRIEKVIEGHGQILSIDDLKQFNNKILSRSAV
jgi:cyclase